MQTSESGKTSGRTFRSRQLEEFCRQLRYTPPDKRMAQLLLAEKLHDEIDPGTNYPLDYIKYRITRWRLESGDATFLVGDAILPDLRLIIDSLSKSLDLRLDHNESMETLETLASRLNVSTKTINRWRKLGLRWRWVSGRLGGRKQIAFTDKAVELFIQRHSDRVSRAEQFTQIPPSERNKIISRAARILRARNVSFNHICEHLARKTGRSLETIRLLIEKHDSRNPDNAVFRHRTGPLTSRQKKIIARAHQRGISIKTIMQRFNRSRSTIYRAVYEHQAAERCRHHIHYIFSKTFDREEADDIYLQRDILTDALSKASISHVSVDDLPAPLNQLFHQRVIDPSSLQSLFLRYNYSKYVATALQQRMRSDTVSASDLKRFDRLMHHAGELKCILVKTHLPVVLSIARRHVAGLYHHQEVMLLPLLQHGNQVLCQTIESYEPSRSQPFSSYLSNRLMQAFVQFSARQESTRPLARRRNAVQEQVAATLAAPIGFGHTLADLINDTCPHHEY